MIGFVVSAKVTSFSSRSGDRDFLGVIAVEGTAKIGSIVEIRREAGSEDHWETSAGNAYKGSFSIEYPTNREPAGANETIVDLSLCQLSS